MTTSTGRWMCTHGGVTCFAKVEVTVDAAAEASIEFLRLAPGEVYDADAVGVPAPGYAIGYDEWTVGARLGVEFALDSSRVGPVSVVVRRIIGTAVDTTVGAVAAAAAIAVWTALEHTAGDDATERLQRCVLEGRNSPDRVREILMLGEP